MSDEPDEMLAEAYRLLAEARATNQRLNRRVQEAEGTLRKREVWRHGYDCGLKRGQEITKEQQSAEYRAMARKLGLARKENRELRAALAQFRAATRSEKAPE